MLLYFRQLGFTLHLLSMIMGQKYKNSNKIVTFVANYSNYPFM
jgi:hypothetical protein